MNSPLQLNRHFFNRIHLDAHPEARPEVQTDIRTTCELGKDNNNPRNARLSLNVEILAKGTEIPAYTGHFEIVGFFSVHPDYPEDGMNALVLVNGGGMLFGAIREMLANLTARGPQAMVMLPTLNFQEMLKQPEVPSKEALKE
jgi:preprotein translocase subunit SecB